MRIEVPPVALSTMMSAKNGEDSQTISARVTRAHEVQLARQNCLNARLDGDALRKIASPDAAGQKLLDQIIAEDRLTARGFNRVLRVARTLADLNQRAYPDAQDMASALLWRGLEASF